MKITEVKQKTGELMKIISSKPKKKRKMYFQSKLHQIHKQLAAHLSEKLRKELKTRSLTVRKNDVVKVLRGEHKKKQGKVIKVDYKKRQVFIEGITRKKTDGTEIPIPFNASNLMIIELDTTDKKRLKNKRKETEKNEKEKDKISETKKEKDSATAKKEQ